MRPFARVMFRFYLESSNYLPTAMVIYRSLQSRRNYKMLPTPTPCPIAILKDAPSELTRTRVLIALGEKLKDPRAVPILVAHLSDPDPFARYDALDGIKNITREKACTLSRDWKEQDVEPQISRCKAWWEQVGQFRDWTQD